MVTTTVITNLLLASAALATPFLDTQLKSRAPETPVNKTSVKLDLNNRAGAVYNKPRGTITGVRALIILPTPSGSGSATSAWVGIDGDTCQNAMLRVGIDTVLLGGQKEPSFSAWYQWFPEPPKAVTGMNFLVGDIVSFDADAFSFTNGLVMVTNRRDNQVFRTHVTSNHSLCMQDAGWIVENHLLGDNMTNFGTLAFVNAVTYITTGFTGPGNARVLNIHHSGTHISMTSTSVDANSVTISHS